MPTASSSFESSISLPPRVVAIRHAVFDAPDETVDSLAVPTNYKLYISDYSPFTPSASGIFGINGDWYIWVQASSVTTYRMILGTWTLVSSITGGGGGGGGGGPISGVTISNCTFEDGIINDSVINTSVLNTPTITAPVVTAGVFTSPVLTTPVITTPAISGGVIDGASIINVPNPTLPGDAANKAYVDGLSAGFVIHEPVVASTTGSNITLAGGAPDEIDDIALSVNDRVLVKDQTNPVQNGIYVVTTLGTGANGTWTRATDADTGNELDSAYVLVSSGTMVGGQSWVVSGTPTIGTDPVNWVQFFALTSVPAGIITGTLTASQIGSVNASVIAGLITASQINTINANQIAGTITASQIGTVNASAITGTITSTQIGSVSATAISGSIIASQIGSVSAATITGVIVSNQLIDQILNTQRLIASDISVVKRLTTLPTLPNSDYPAGSLVLNTTNKTLYQNVAGAWTVVTASSNVVGTLTSNDIASVNANSIVGLIIASQIGSVSASSITGSITSSQIGSVAASAIVGSITSSQIGSVAATAITGSITASQITSVNASAITGTISSSQIGSVSASSITGTISSTQIGSVNANTITLGSLSAINYTVGSGENQTTINSTGLAVGLLKIDGASNQNTIAINGFFPVQLTGGNASAALSLGNIGGTGTVQISGGGSTNHITVVNYGGLGRNGSGRFELSAASTNSISFATNSSERWIIGGSDGHLKAMSASYDIRKVTDDGWSVRLWDGSNSLEFRWDGGLQVRIDGGSVFDVTTT